MGVFFKDDPDVEVKKAAKAAAKANKSKTIETSKPQPIQPTYASTQPMYTSTQMVTNMIGVADEKFVQMLKKVIEDNNIPGQDYFELRQSLDAPEIASLPDERTKFIIVYTTFKLQGCTKEHLLSSVDKYISIVQNEEKNFNNELATQKNDNITAKTAQVEQVRRELDDLSRQIAEKNTFIITASQEIQNAELKLQMTENSFKKSVEKVIGMLQSDKDKINSYIQ
jgi:hypothetical protein